MAAPWRRSPLPPDWAERRLDVLKRDEYVCQLQGRRCITYATEVDHKGAHDDHRLPMLQAVCRPCHASKTGREARAVQVAASKDKTRVRPREPHPGLRP